MSHSSKRNVTVIAILTLLLTIWSCSKDSSTPQTDVYVLGAKNVSGTWSYNYWKDGVPTAITGIDVPSMIAVSGTDIYIAGSTGVSFQAAVSKNGTVSLLSMSSGSTNASVLSIFIDGNDVYVSGAEYNNGSTSIAKYWKNGVETVLSDGTSFASAQSVFVSGSDVYVGGTDKGHATLWKNGIPTQLSTLQSGISSVAVVNGDVYAAGTEYISSKVFVAKYWKNGTPVVLSGGAPSAGLGSIAVSNGIVYACGNVIDTTAKKVIAAYWKDGVVTRLYDGAYSSTANILQISRTGDVYIAGATQVSGTFSGLLWKNGILVSPFLGTDFTLDTRTMCLN